MIEIKEDAPLFASPLFMRTLDLPDISSFVLDMSSSTKGQHQTNIGGWQSPMFHNPIDPIIDPIWDAIENQCNACNTQLGLTGRVRIQSMWFNINSKGHFNWRHAHIGSVHSGTYYVKAPPNSGDLIFFNPNDLSALSSWIRVLPTGADSSNIIQAVRQDEVYVKPYKNLFMMFPSWLEHSVKPNETDEKRISVAFDMGIA